jgi:DMSO/TMAO reductase YedYZ heme-binding membrane subunit
MEGKMAFCYCRFILALLVIVFAWWHFSWSPIILTVIGVLLAILALKRDWCCRERGKKKEKEVEAEAEKE